MVSQKEIIEELRGECNGCKRDMLADRIEAEGIAPPDGWVLVPSEPTKAMIDAGCQWRLPSNVYTAMLAAAPKGGSHE